MVRLSTIILVGCGRISFESVGGSEVVPDGDATVVGVACADIDLGSALGPNVASGTTAGETDEFDRCSGDGVDVSFGWFAPATGSFQIDLCASPGDFDATLSVRNGSCTGTELACDNSSCGGVSAPPRLTVDLTAGQAIVIVIDGDGSNDTGTYQLAVTRL